MQHFIATTSDAQRQVSNLGLRTLFVASIALFILILIASATRRGADQLKKVTFGLIGFVVVVASGIMTGATFYLNSKAEGGGPQKRTAGIELWACGVQLEIRNPDWTVSNKVGTPTLHEHDDQLIHLDGAVVYPEREATLGAFIRAIGGSVTSTSLQVPVAKSVVENSTDADAVDPAGALRVAAYLGQDGTGGDAVTLPSTGTCDGQAARLQAYVLRTSGEGYTQEKISDIDSFQFKQANDAPPGDCIIVSFDRPSDRTDRRCAGFYESGIREELGGRQ